MSDVELFALGAILLPLSLAACSLFFLIALVFNSVVLGLIGVSIGGYVWIKGYTLLKENL